MPSSTDPETLPQQRLATPVGDVMRPGVVTIAEDAPLLHAKRAMVRHGIHAVLVVGKETGRPLGWVSDHGLLSWLERDLATVPAAHAITEPPRFVDAGATARSALDALAEQGVGHLLVGDIGRPPQGVIAPLDLVDLVTRP
jgi:CBS domain-containing protein